MRGLVRAGVGMAVVLGMTGGAMAADTAPGVQVAQAPAAVGKANPLVKPWDAPHGGIPWNVVKAEDFKPALEAAMAEHKAEIAKIAGAKDEPTFENTILALETAGATLARVSAVFNYLGNAYTSDAIEATERDMAPALAKHSDDISLNPDLFRRVASIYERRGQLNLKPDALRLVERTYTGFVRAGAKLDEAGKKKLADINGRLATLYTTFSQNQLADEKAWTMVLETEADMAGLPPDLKAAALQAGKQRGQEGKHLVTLSRSLVEPFLTYSDRRDLREKAFRAWSKRGDNDNATDNKKIIAEILGLRTERAKLLGFPTFAHYATDDVMAKTPQAVLDLIAKVWGPAVRAMARDRKELQEVASKMGQKEPIEAWDWRYYAEKVRKAKYDLDEAETKPYFELSRMTEAKFEAANRLFGVTFRELKDMPVYAPEVKVYEMLDKDGKHKALFYADDFARPQKRSGAWMNQLRGQDKLRGFTAIASNNNNFAAGADGKTLLSFDDAQTLFHEFGHALHGIMSDVTYPSQSGTNVDRDFVEFPSQVFERWFSTPEILNKYARHYKTGEPMPKALLDRVLKAKNFNSGWRTMEYLASAVVDMEMHLNPEAAAKDVNGFEKATLAKYGLPSDIIMRHRPPHFGHLFSGEGYAAGYYTYLWSDQMGADGWNAFVEAGNVFDPAVAKKFLDYVYAAGDSRAPDQAYIGFRGRLPTVEPLLEARGLVAAPTGR